MFLQNNCECEILKTFDFLISKGQTLVVATHSDVVAKHCTSTYCLYNGVKTLAFRRNL